MTGPPRHATVPVAAPPPVPEAPPVGAAARLIPLSTLAVTAAMVAVVFAVGSPMSSNPMFLMFPVMMAVSALASLAGGRRGHTDLDATRRRYLRYLHGVGEELSEHAAAQHQWLIQQYPDPTSLWQLARSDRRFERHRGHDGFCRIRCGVGAVVAAAQPIPPPAAELAEVDPVTAATVQRLVSTYATVPDAPVTVDLRAAPLLRLLGEISDTAAWARAMLCQLATFHTPADVAIAVVCAGDRRRDWEWLKWLPHHGHPHDVDDAGPVRLTYHTVADALADDAAGRHRVIVVDGVAAEFTVRADVTLLCLGGVAGAGEVVWDIGNEDVRPDVMTVSEAVACARQLAGGVPLAVHPAEPVEPLRVPLGTAESGEPVYLDIREPALGGNGPHGLCIGATGSGKSELLRTVAVGMIAQHPVDELNLILVDFKGGATFLDLQRAPHVAAVITNLADEAHLVDRMQEALHGEMHRRQQLLRSAGNLSKAADYSQLRNSRPDLPPLPTLLVIVDEFSELLSRHPDFIDVFTAIGRVGRSLGVHLLLASQRLDDGRLRGLESHLSYRICLKTLSANESRAVLGVPDAHHLPATPGAAFLKVGADDPVRLRAACVSAPSMGSRRPRVDTPRHPVVFTSAAVGRTRSGIEPRQRRTVLDATLDAVDVPGPVAHQVWLPPLTVSPRLDELPSPTALTVPIGLSDRVFEQRRVPVLVDLSGSAGNAAVVGAPRSGKSTVLTTLVTALCLNHSPAERQFYCLDFGGGALGLLSGLPHLGVVAGRHQPELVRRTVAQVAAELRRREASATRDGEVFLIVDGWATLRQEFDDLENTVLALATEGLAHGVHVILTATRWADIRAALKDQLGSRIELRLADPIDSEVDRARARQVPKDRPGAGLAPDGFPMTVAVVDDLAAVVARSAARHGGQRAPAVHTLPTRVDHAGLALPAQPVLGIGDNRMTLLGPDFDARPHLLVFGDPACGKTSVLRLLVREIHRTSPPGSAELHVLDPRRTLGKENCTGYADTAQRCADLVADLVVLLQPRMGSTWTGPVVYLVIDDHDLISRACEPLVELIPHARDIGLRLVTARRGGARTLYDPLVSAMRDTAAAVLQMSQAGDDAGRGVVLPQGRAVLTAGPDQQLVQLAWTPPR